MGFADMLKQAREKVGLSQAALAERTGLPLRSIQNWEQGHRTPRVAVVLKLARTLGVRVEGLLVAMAEGEPASAPRRKRQK
jgi:transcriptional regulator with XRE-family HTH domain